MFIPINPNLFFSFILIFPGFFSFPLKLQYPSLANFPIFQQIDAGSYPLNLNSFH